MSEIIARLGLIFCKRLIRNSPLKRAGLHFDIRKLVIKDWFPNLDDYQHLYASDICPAAGVDAA